MIYLNGVPYKDHLYYRYVWTRKKMLFALHTLRQLLKYDKITPAHFENLRLIYQSALARIRGIYYA